jgi:hypothetical protein
MNPLITLKENRRSYCYDSLNNLSLRECNDDVFVVMHLQGKQGGIPLVGTKTDGRTINIRII